MQSFFPRAALYAALFTTTLSAQDPVPPPGGFGILTNLDNLVTYSDGYRTRLDMRMPDHTPAPMSGWPVAMVVHGGGGSRKRGWVMSIAENLTRQGYITLCYDTGGNGVTQTLNPPGQRDNALRIRDIAEIFRFAKTQLTNRMDENRLAMTGKSGGGRHSHWGAAFSGRPLPLPSPTVTHMPVIRAIVSDIQVMNPVADQIPGGNMVAAEWAISAFDNLGPTAALTQRIAAKDYGWLQTYIQTDPGTGYFPLLQTSSVPMIISFSVDDKNHGGNVNADAFPLLAAGVPRRYLQLTGGHATAPNNIAVTLRRDFIQRWFDRFLKGINNQVGAEPFAEISVLPSNPTNYLDAASEWKHRRFDTWPQTANSRFYMRGNGTLQSTAPSGVEGTPALLHQVPASFGLRDFVTARGAPSTVVSSIPLDRVSFDGPVRTQPADLTGRTVVTFDVVPRTTNDYQIQAALIDVDGSGTERFITSGVIARRGVTTNRQRVQIELDDIGYVLPAGHRLRVSLENMNLRRQPGNAHFYALPEFESFALEIQIDAIFSPRVDLPLRNPPPSLTPRIARVQGTSGFAQDFHIRGESHRAGLPYFLFVGGSGNTPGVNVPPRIPLNPDLYTLIGIYEANSPLFANFFGTLNGAGRGTATFRLPAPIASVTLGLRFNFAALVEEAPGVFSSTAPADLLIWP